MVALDVNETPVVCVGLGGFWEFLIPAVPVVPLEYHRRMEYSAVAVVADAPRVILTAMKGMPLASMNWHLRHCAYLMRRQLVFAMRAVLPVFLSIPLKSWASCCELVPSLVSSVAVGEPASKTGFDLSRHGRNFLSVVESHILRVL